MLRIPNDPGDFYYRGPSGQGGCFLPNGQSSFVGLANPREWSIQGKNVLSARLFVGFNVGDEPRWTMDDVIGVTKDTRFGIDKPDATFILQKGIYKHREGGQRMIEEDGAQIIIIDIWGTSYDVFVEEMEKLAENLAEELEQETVILEIQKGGVPQETIGIKPS